MAHRSIQLGAHFLILVSMVVASRETLYLRLSMHDLWVSEFRGFLLWWLVAALAILAIRGLRAAYAFGGMGGPYDQYHEWYQKGVMPAFYIQRFLCLGKQPGLGRGKQRGLSGCRGWAPPVGSAMWPSVPWMWSLDECCPPYRLLHRDGALGRARPEDRAVHQTVPG